VRVLPSMRAANIYVSTGNGTFDADTGGSDYGDSIINLVRAAASVSLITSRRSTRPILARTISTSVPAASWCCPTSQERTRTSRFKVAKKGQSTSWIATIWATSTMAMTARLSNPCLSSVAPSFARTALFNGKIYCNGAVDVLKEFALTNGLLSTNPVSQSANAIDFPGATPSVSANGTNNGIVWIVQTDAFFTRTGQAVLHAYDATDLTRELYNSATSRQPPGKTVKFAVPTVANGKVYVGVVHRLTVYGLR